MKFLEKIYNSSNIKKFTKINLLTSTLLVITIFLVPMIFIARIVITQSGVLIDPNKWSIATWILSIISFICGLISVILSVMGINRKLGS